jgi:hypothetical protein
MKTWLALLFVALIGIAAFLMGRGKSGGQARPEITETSSLSTTAQGQPAPIGANLKPKARTGADVLAPEKAAKLSIEDRITLLKKAALLDDPEKQADILCGLLSVMTQEELEEATKTLLDAQRRGNNWSQEVWNTLWTQWGRVNAEGCLALSKTGEGYPGWNGLNGLNTPDDYRCLMVGWLESHPEAAMAWARQPKDNLREATAAAFAITSTAKGDLKQMESAILSISGDELTARACFRDYFDLATSTGDKPLPSVIYERLDPKLRAAAWSEVVQRLIYTDLGTAVSWFEKHGNDPGHDFAATAELVSRLSDKDPEGTAKWAVKLPVSSENQHPGVIAYTRWHEINPAAANAWAKTQPQGLLWIREPAQPSLGNGTIE